jgi:hypothetical protein
MHKLGERWNQRHMVVGAGSEERLAAKLGHRRESGSCNKVGNLHESPP